MIANQKQKFYYVYVLLSKKDKHFYVGFSEDLQSRLQSHKKGEVLSTKDRRPLHLIYSEVCLHKKDALRREKYLKTHLGRMFLHNRLKSYLTG